MAKHTTRPAQLSLQIAICLTAIPAISSRAPAQSPETGAVEVRYPVRDSLTVTADVYRGTAGADGPTILLFHQGGGSARGEYRNITPRLLREGYNVVAVDHRGGGDRFGAPNRANVPDSVTFSYCDVLPEIDATVNLARAQGLGGPMVLWGSSYSATLALQVGARRSADVRAVVAFSPASGPPMRGCEAQPYMGWLARAGVAALVLRPRAELGDTGRVARLEAMRREGAVVHIAEKGVHGSSMLDAERTGTGTEAEWNTVLAFLRRNLELPPANQSERTVSIPSDGWVLHGDLVLPERSPAPVVILLHKAAGDRKIFRDLAGRLGAAGIGSLRVDLRGHGASINRGRFVPGQPGSIMDDTERDIAAISRFIRTTAGVDTTRLGIVSGSYSSQAAALAVREIGFGRVQVALSPGDFSDESFRAAGTSTASWLFIRSDREHFVDSRLDRKIKLLAPRADLWVLSAGSAHATDLLAADPSLAERLTEWLRQRLGS